MEKEEANEGGRERERQGVSNGGREEGGRQWVREGEKEGTGSV